MERIGLVGLPNAGKSALFNALTGGSAVVASHPFSTTETSVGVAYVPDERLVALATMSASKKVVQTGFEIVDIAGLVAGAGQGEGLGNRFLAGIREVDALCYVLRSFAERDVVGEADPLEALAVLELELVLADLSSIEAQLTRSRRTTRANPALAGPGAAALERAAALLEAGTPIYRSGLSVEDRALLQPVFLLTNKPVLVVVNLGEDEIESAASITEPVAAELGATAEVLGVSVRLEAEAAELAGDERAELLAGLGLGEGALARVARAAYHLIGRRTFFTTGDKESRAWTYRAGAKAPECAGVIHTDLQRGFIRAEVIHYDELLALGSWAAAKAAGKLRLEGKEYEVLDGDVLEIRFNV
jgi:GTP-binding protein YchF